MPHRFAWALVTRFRSRARRTRNPNRENEKAWDEQIYCVPSEEQRFNRLIRDGGVGKE